MLYSLLALLPVASAAAVSLAVNPPHIFARANIAQCANQPFAYSCEAGVPANTCCSPYPGGLQLFTAFWDTYTGREKQGQLLPAGSWTLHGLWPDNCDGSYESYCDLSRQYDPSPSPNKTSSGETIPPYKGPSIAQYLKKFRRPDLYQYMNTFWVAQGQPNDEFWAHEFSKHATCTSTFDKACYANYQEGEDVIDFFEAAIRGFQHFPHYDILASFGIVPSNSTTYSLSDMQNAYKSQTGALPYFGCQRDANGQKTILSEIWVNAHVLGTPSYGQYKAVDTPATSSCVTTPGAIHYYLRSPGSETTSTVY